MQDDGWPLALRPRHRRAQTRLVPLQRGLFVRPQVHLLQHLPRDLARATPEAVDRLILDTSRYTTAAMQGCSRRHPTTVLGLWQEMHDILSGPDAESYRYPLDDLQRVSTVRHLVEGTLAVTQLS